MSDGDDICVSGEDFAGAIADAEKRGAVKALRHEAQFFYGAAQAATIPADKREAYTLAATRIQDRAGRIESGEVTL
jgi:hypothetical protein